MSPFPILYVSRNPHPRLAVASTRFIKVPITIESAAPLAPGQDAKFRSLNPNLLLPILDEGHRTLWECDAVICRLSMMIGSDFWPTDDRLPELIRWISWGKENFVRGCDMVQFELGTKRRYNLGQVDNSAIDRGTELFHTAAGLLEAELERRDWLVGDQPTYADFRMATFLPFNNIMHLPLEQYPALNGWNTRLEGYDCWHDPFWGLDVPALPPLGR